MANDGLAIGDTIGTYRIVGALAPNAYRAVHLASPRRVVIHVGGTARWREIAIDVLRAARMIDSLGHAGIAPIVDRGVLADRRPWWASEVPNGVRLYELLARRTLESAEVAGLVHDVADVLAHAHERGIVHGSLTLRSIVLATGERKFPLCITDWGLPAEDHGVFAAPEGASGQSAVDVYALGVIAYRAATRRFPVDGASDDLPGVAPGLARLIAHMLAADPDKRPASADVRAVASKLRETDVVPVSTPRFSKPKWTPAPPITISSAGADRADASGEIVGKNN